MEIGSLAAQMGRRALVITTHHAGRAAPLFIQLSGAKVEYVTFEIDHEPTTDVVLQGTQLARDHDCDLVIGFGGGSVIDTGKAIAALLTNPGDVLDYLEVIGRGQTLTQPSAPYIAIPTTAGTGSEVTRNAVLASPKHKVKVSMRSAFMLPTLALVDPDLMRSLPPDVTAYTGLDALTQVIEPFVSKQANPVTDALCREGMWRAGRSLLRAYSQGNDAVAREDMALVASVRRAGAGKRQAGRGTRLRGTAGRHVRRAAWGGMRGAAAARHGEKRRGAARAPAGQQRAAAL